MPQEDLPASVRQEDVFHQASRRLREKVEHDREKCKTLKSAIAASNPHSPDIPNIERLHLVGRELVTNEKVY